MIGCLTNVTIAPASTSIASAFSTADAHYVRLARNFFDSQGWRAEISTSDRFIRARVPLVGEEDPHGFLRTLGNVQSLLQDKTRLIHIEKDGSNLVAHLGFAFPSLLTGLLHFLYGGQAMTPVFLSRDVDRREINRMYHRNEQPVGLFEEPKYLADIDKIVDAFIFAYHDLYHLAFGSALPLRFRAMWAALFDRVEALPSPIVATPLAQSLLNALTDNDIDLRFAESEEMLAFVPFRAVMDRIQEAHRLEDNEDSIAIFGECARFLGAFLGALGNADDPAFVHADFMMRNLREMKRVSDTQISLREAAYGLF